MKRTTALAVIFTIACAIAMVVPQFALAGDSDELEIQAVEQEGPVDPEPEAEPEPEPEPEQTEGDSPEPLREEDPDAPQAGEENPEENLTGLGATEVEQQPDECEPTVGEEEAEPIVMEEFPPEEHVSGPSELDRKPDSDVGTQAVKVQQPQEKVTQATTTKAKPKAAAVKQVEKHAAELAGLVNGHVYIFASKNAGGQALEANSGNVYQSSLTRSTVQQWRVVFDSNGYIRLQNVGTGKYLDVSGAKAYAGANIIDWKGNGGSNQLWSVLKNSDGSYTLVSAFTYRGAAMALDIAGASKASGANALLWNSKGSANQKWGLTDASAMWARLDEKARASKGQLAAGSYVAVAGNARGKVLDVTGNSAASGANIEIWASNNGANQKWRVTVGSDGYATITSVRSGKVLDVSGAKAVAGTNVIQWPANGGRNQKWIVTENPDGTYQVASALWEGLVLDIAGNSSKSGANVELWTPNGGANQKWDMANLNPTVPATASVSSGWYYLRSALNAGYYLDVTGANAANGTPLELWTKNATPAQAFRIFKAGNYYRIETGAGSGSYLDVEGGKVVPGTKAEVWRSTSNATLYSLQKNADGSYRFVNVASGLALAVTSGSAGQGASVTAEKSRANAAAQGFFLVSREGLLESGIYSVRSVLSGNRAVSVKDGSYASGGTMALSSYNQGINQKWQVKAVPGHPNAYTLESLSSGYKLTGANNAAVTQRPTAGNSTQWWEPSWSNGAYILRNASTGKVLDASGAKGTEGTQLVNWSGNGGANQRFTLTGVAAVDSGIYEFLCPANVSKALDVTGASVANGAKLEVYQRNNGANQKFKYDAATGTLQVLSSGKLVDVNGASAKSGSAVIQWDANGGNNQKWTITYMGDGKFKVASKMGSSLVLTAAAATNGAAVTNSTYTGDNRQQWRLVKNVAVQPTGFNLIDSIVSNGHGSLDPSYVVIHETANPGATAKNHRDYWAHNDTYAVHYTVDWTGNCYYCVPEDRLCWQVGKGNKYVVGIELCHATNKADFNKVYKYGVNWATWQLAKRGWGVDRLISHYDCTKKWGGSDHTDPIGYFQSYGKSWAQFKEDVRKALASR